jgi:hypothetical protein
MDSSPPFREDPTTGLTAPAALLPELGAEPTDKAHLRSGTLLRRTTILHLYGPMGAWTSAAKVKDSLRFAPAVASGL